MSPLSRASLTQRGSCCGLGCLNCPYTPRHAAGTTRIKESLMSERTVVCVTQTEQIRRTFWVSVPKGMDDDRLKELFFEQDIGGCDHHGERYAVDLDLNLSPDSMPSDVDPIEIDEDGDPTDE